MSLAEKIRQVQDNIAAAAREAGRDPGGITLVAATKVQTSQTIREAIAAGVGVCGENRVQEMTAHLADNAYEGARLHFIGHLQTNKVKFVVGRVDLIESVGSQRLLEAIEHQAAKLGVVQDILLEVNIGAEESKSGVAPCEVRALAEYAAAKPHVLVRGLMAIPPAETVPGQARRYFAQMKTLFDKLADAHIQRVSMDVLSMGMSADFESAILEGATLVRVGTAIFGARSYPA